MCENKYNFTRKKKLAYHKQFKKKSDIIFLIIILEFSVEEINFMVQII